MKNFFICIVIVSCMFFSGCNKSGNLAINNNSMDMSSRLITISEGSSIEDIASSVVYGIVGIETDSAIGSGVAISREGYILTNSHVVNGASFIKLHLFDGTYISAEIVYEDTVLDIALLKADKGIPYLRLASIDDVAVGEEVLAVGTPLSLTLSHSFTKGIVSALNRTLRVNSAGGTGFMQNLIQHDASLNSGNSGGPLLNTKGEIVGINTLKISGGDGVGFAIPVKAFYSLVSNLIGVEDYAVPYLGLFGYDAGIEKLKGKDVVDGFYVLDISSTSPLKSMLEVDSVITKINGIDIASALDFRNELYKCKANDKISISFVTDGVEYEILVSLDEK